MSSLPKTPKKVERSFSGTPAIVSSQADSETVAQIDSFGFNSRPKIGIGGFLTVDIYPVVLFRSGDALTNLLFSGGLEAHKRAKPGNWTRWRRQGGSAPYSLHNKSLPERNIISRWIDR